MKTHDGNQDQAKPKVGLLKNLLRFNIREILLVVVILSFSLAWFTNREEWSPEVLRLFSIETRDEALQKLLEEATYPAIPKLKETSSGKIVDVIVCPQHGKPPLVTVLVDEYYSRGNQVMRISTNPHMMVFRSDGTFVPWYLGANVLDGEMLDLTGDGVIDWIEEIDMSGYPEGDVTTIHIVPVQEPFVPALLLVWKTGMVDWKLIRPKRGDPTLQIRSNEGSGVVAEYSWSKKEERWVGPRGTADLGFMVADGGDVQAAVTQLFEPE